MTGAARGDLFDKSEEYEAMLDQGLRLSGEDRHYFIAGRLQALRAVHLLAHILRYVRVEASLFRRKVVVDGVGASLRKETLPFEGQ